MTGPGDDRPAFNAQLRQTLWAGLTGRAGDVTGAPGADLRATLQAAFGEGRRAGSVNTRAAAQGLGVTQRQVQYYLSGQRRPGAATRDRIAAAARRAATTQRGRRTATAAVRRSPLGRTGARLTVRGKQGPIRAGTAYRRDRRVDVDLPRDDLDALLSAYEQGGDRAAVDWLSGYLDAAYVDNWSFENIDGLQLGDPEDPDR